MVFHFIMDHRNKMTLPTRTNLVLDLIISIGLKESHFWNIFHDVIQNKSEAFHFIANSSPNVEVVTHLRWTILKGAEHVIKAQRPISYLNFESKILEKYQSEVRIRRTEAVDMARAAGIKGEEAVDALLRYFTNKGILLYYPEVKSLENEIFISPDEVSKLVCTVITTESCKPHSAALQRSYKRYEKYALLEESLFDFMLKQCGRDKDKDVILGLLDKFSIAAEVPVNTLFPEEFTAPKKGRVFMIPSLLVYDKTEGYRKAKDDIVVVHYAPNEFLPETVFNKLLVKTINWCYQDTTHSHQVRW